MDPNLYWNKPHPIHVSHKEYGGHPMFNPKNDRRKSYFYQSPLFVTFEQTIPMETYRYLMDEDVHPFHPMPHFGIPGGAFVKRERKWEKNNEWKSNEGRCFWNEPRHKKWGKAVSGFLLVCVHWDKFTPKIVKNCMYIMCVQKK